jgi:hypothetical protein
MIENDVNGVLARAIQINLCREDTINVGVVMAGPYMDLSYP